MDEGRLDFFFTIYVLEKYFLHFYGETMLVFSLRKSAIHSLKNGG
jgi:hypothetical protein